MTEPFADADVDLTLDHAGDPGLDPFDRIAEEFADRCRRGESPTVAEYVERFPDLADRIRALLPPVAMMERLKGRARAAGPSSGLHEPRLERLGEYRILRELGRGGMGIVYEAFQESLGRHVALKVIPRHGLLDAKRRQRFQREAQAVAQLHHTNIVPIFAAGEHDGLPFYAMQCIRGSGLDRFLDDWRRDGRARDADHWRFVARVGIQAAEALQYAHDQGILHRDVKPANILIDEHQVAWITDFGLAKLVGREELTNSGDIVGTLRYLAPESLRGQTDRRSDIYSLGLTLYELLTLQLPFGDRSPSELLRCVTEEQPVRPRKLDRSIPIDLETIVLKATAREPEHRYPRAVELADDLRAFLDDRPIRARRASVPEQLGRWYRRNRVLAWVSAFAAASSLAALVIAVVGYVETRQALGKSEANVKLSLEEFERLFNAFADPGDAGPFADGATAADPRHPEPMPDRPDGPPPGRPRGKKMAPEMAGVGLPPPRPGDGPRPSRGPKTSGPVGLSDREIAVLEGVLDFFDKFAERNETNPRLQFEAAKAHRKVAAIYRFLDHREKERAAEAPASPGEIPQATTDFLGKAEEARAQAVKGFESLAARDASDPNYRYELARTIAWDGPDAMLVPADRANGDLRRAVAIVSPLLVGVPAEKRTTYEAALARWNMRMAWHASARGLDEDAAAYYRASISHDEWVVTHVSDPTPVHGVLATNREALARILIRLGRADEARPVLEQSAEDLADLVRAGRPVPIPDDWLAKLAESMADSFETLGAPARATQLGELAKEIRARPRPGWPGSHGGGPRGRRGGPPPHLDREPGDAP